MHLNQSLITPGCQRKTLLDVPFFIRRDVVQAETDMYSQMNMNDCAKRVNDARMLKSYIDTLLNQIYEDCCQQGNAVNESFRRRIDEIKEAKTKLEQRHHEVYY